MPTTVVKQSLLGLPRSIKRGLVIFCDVLVCSLSVWLSLGLRLDQWGLLKEGQWIAVIASICLSLPIFINFGLYRAIFRYVGTVAFVSIARAFLIYGCLFFCIFTLFGVNEVPRSVGVIQPILLFIGVGASRYLVRYWLGEVNDVRGTQHRPQAIALIYGAGSAGRELAAGFSGGRGMLIKGFVDDNIHLQGSTINGIPVYSKERLPNLIHDLGVTDILLAIPLVAQRQRTSIISSLNGCGVRVRTIPGLNDLASGRVRISDLHDLDMNDLLGREVVPPNTFLLEKNIRNKVVLVTGAGGSIGSELCRQIIKFSPKSVVLIDSSEHSLYLIYEELKGTLAVISNQDIEKACAQFPIPQQEPSIKVVPCLASVRDRDVLLKIFGIHQPNTVFHAAAYKHVPLVEQNPAEGIRNNVSGTLTCAQISLNCGVANFILVSTDKAVRPTNIMGASKRIAELVLQAMADVASRENHSTNFSMVRFGNVLGSSGSVTPLFSGQIAAGGPITLTDTEVTRYFMTIPEAAQLVIQASAMAEGGDVFVLDMGDPVRIYDLAIRMIYLSGLLVKDELHPNGDIEIKVTGLRPGEKLYEELLIGDSPQPTAHAKIMKANEEFLAWEHLQGELEKLNLALDACDSQLIGSMLKKLVPGYQPSAGSVDWGAGI